MGTLWIKNGHLIIANGKFVVCDTDPCTADCYTDVIAAIRERQGILGRTVWAADAEKTLAQCITEVNAIAPGYNSAGVAVLPFIAGTYSGGASAPTLRTSSYATGAADFCALYALVCALVTTKVPFTSSSSTGLFRWYSSSSNVQWNGRASDASSSYDFSTLVSTAEANWSNAGGVGFGSNTYYAAKVPKRSGINRSATINGYQQTLYVTGLATSTSRAARAFVRVAHDGGEGHFHALGYHSIGEDEYGLIASQSAGSWATWSLTWPESGTLSRPSPWPGDPVDSNATRHDFEVKERFLLVDWSFTHV